MKRNDAILLAGLVLFTAFVRLWGITDVGTYMFDESTHVPSAKSYVLSGHTIPETYWSHPHLKHILLYASIKIYGDNPYGWRLKNAVAGILSCWFLFLLGRRFLSDDRIAYLSAAFLSIDPLHIYLSRTTSEEIAAVLFLLISVYGAVQYVDGRRNFLFVSGVFLGLANSMKWYFIPASFVIVAYILYFQAKKQELSWPNVLLIISVMIILPLGIYLLPYYPWFGRGYDLKEFIQMQTDAYRANQGYTADMYSRELTYSSSAVEWFIKPIMIGTRISGDAGWSRYHVLMSNFPLWMLFIPSSAYLMYRTLKDKNRHLLLLSALIMAVYLQFLFVKRPIFLYSALPVLPFACIAVAFAIYSILKKVIDNAWVFRSIVIISLLWGLYLYPVTIGKSVPDVLYDTLFSFGAVSQP